MKFITHNKVRIHDTDAAGLLYFARQFRFANEAMEDLLAHEGLTFPEMVKKFGFMFAIVHCEANYYHPLAIGDEIETHVVISNIGNTSFTLEYKFLNKDQVCVGDAQTVHCTLDAKTRKKITVPDELRSFLVKYT